MNHSLLLFIFAACAAMSRGVEAALAKAPVCPAETASTDFNDDPYPDNFEEMLASATKSATRGELSEMEAAAAEVAKNADADALNDYELPVIKGHYHEMCRQRVYRLRWYRGYWILPQFPIYFVRCLHRFCRFFYHYPCHGYGCGYHLPPYWPSYRCREERNYPVYAYGINWSGLRRLKIWVPQACCCHMWHYWWDFASGLDVAATSAVCPVVNG